MLEGTKVSQARPMSSDTSVWSATFQLFCSSFQPVDQLIDDVANPLPVKQLTRVTVKVAWLNWLSRQARLNMG